MRGRKSGSIPALTIHINVDYRQVNKCLIQPTIHLIKRPSKEPSDSSDLKQSHETVPNCLLKDKRCCTKCITRQAKLLQN